MFRQTCHQNPVGIAKSGLRKTLTVLAILGNKVEKFFGGEPRDIEWAIERNLSPERNILLVQSRPEKTSALKKEKRISKQKGSALDRIVGLVTEGVKVK